MSLEYLINRHLLSLHDKCLNWVASIFLNEYNGHLASLYGFTNSWPDPPSIHTSEGNFLTPDLVAYSTNENIALILDVKGDWCDERPIFGNKREYVEKKVEEFLIKYVNPNNFGQWLTNWINEREIPNRAEEEISNIDYVLCLPSECFRNDPELKDLFIEITQQKSISLWEVHQCSKIKILVNVHSSSISSATEIPLPLEYNSILHGTRNTPTNLLAKRVLQILLNYFFLLRSKVCFTFEDVDRIIQGNDPLYPQNELLLSHLTREERLRKWSIVLDLAVRKRIAYQKSSKICLNINQTAGRRVTGKLSEKINNLTS